MFENFNGKDHSMSDSEIADQNLNSIDNTSLTKKDERSYHIEHLKLKLNESKSDCFVNLQAQVNEHLGSLEHIQSYVNTQAAGIINCVKTEANTQRLDGIEDYKPDFIPQSVGATGHVKSEVHTELSDDVAGYESEASIQNLNGTGHIMSEVYDMKCNSKVDPKPQVENYGGIEHLKQELSDESFDDMTDEKPCLAALRASVAAYSVNQGKKEMELEPFPNTEMSSQEMLEPHCGTASNAQAADQESVDNCPSDARTSEWKEMKIKKRVEHFGKGNFSGCPKTLNEFSQEAEQEKTTIIEVSQSQREILPRETSSDGPFQCFWCPWVFFQFVDRERHMKYSHREEYGKLLQEKYSQNMNGLPQENGLHPCRTSSLPHSGKSLQIVQQKSSESCCNTKSEKTFIKTETPVDVGKSEQNKQAGWKVASNYISKQTYKRFCSLQKSKGHKIHTGETLYCDVCGKGFRDSCNLSAHKRTHTGQKPYKCYVCGKGFGQTCHLSVHMRTHTGETPYKCDMCGRRFGQKGHIYVHMRTHTGETPYKCGMCGKYLRDNRGLSVHKRTHTGEILYKCDMCGKCLRDSRSLPVHMRTHTGETPYKCDMCGKCLRDHRSLSVHKRIHTGETPYKCDVCGKGFRRKHILSVHKRIHTGETPYKCDVCGKGFRDSGHLSVHKRTHTGETPYMCEVCGKGFGLKGNLSVHMRTHTGEQPYKCDVCGVVFRSSSMVSLHKRIHTGETPYKCDV